MSWDTYFYNVEKSELYPAGRTRDVEADLISVGTPAPGSVPTGA
jgi:hypothetical protein